MPIYITVVRLAHCAICTGQWILEELAVPQCCAHCGSKFWELGMESKDTLLIRQGISRLRRRLNPGARSKKRQDQGREQEQAFKPKKPERPKMQRVNRGRPEPKKRLK